MSPTSMALRKSFANHLLDGFRKNACTSDASRINFHRHYLASPDSTDGGIFRRFLPRRAVFHSGQTKSIPEILSLPVGDKLREKLRGIDITGYRNGDGVSPSAAGGPLCGISAEDARKILRISQMEKLRAKLREIPNTSISYCHYLQICVEVCDSEHQGEAFAKKMDESGNVIVLGNVVFLRPDQVAKKVESLIRESIANPKDPRRKELEVMEKQKEKIDDKAKAMVRRELYCGLGLLTAQTIGFMRLTFWELSWDVMEPICFFVTSLHVALAYLFYLRTSTEPTFQGYFHRRFTVKQKKLMRSYNFDVQKYNDLRNACYA